MANNLAGNGCDLIGRRPPPSKTTTSAAAASDADGRSHVPLVAVTAVSAGLVPILLAVVEASPSLLQENKEQLVLDYDLEK